MKNRLGLDLGGTSAKVALVTPRGKILREGSVSTTANISPGELVRQLCVVAHRLIKNQRVRDLGVGVAGDIDDVEGKVRISPNLGWKNVPLKSLLQKRMKKFRILVDNDANAAAWGIYKTQVNPRVKHMIAITLGTGVGGGIIINGKLHRGGTGSAGEVGHMDVEREGRLCNCGYRGCLEAYSGGFYMARQVREDLEMGEKSQLQQIFREDPDQINARLIAKAAQKGDRYAQKIWKNAGTMLGRALGDLIYILNPEIIFLTGGVSQAKNLILNPLKKTLKDRTFRTPISHVQIRVARNPAHVGVVGASLLE